MAVVRCKPGVVFGGFSAGLCHILTVLEQTARVWTDAPQEIMITSGSDGVHQVNSRHYRFEALDVRSQTFPPAARARFQQTLATALGSGFSVLLEGASTPNEHWHIQVKKGQRFP